MNKATELKEMKIKEAKEKVLKILIGCEISLYTCIYGPDKAVVPISNILHLSDGMTKYRARQALKSLISDGLICYMSQGCPAICSPSTESHYAELIDEARPPINGYTLTKKAFETQPWKDAYDRWNKSMEEWANGYGE